MSEDVTLATLAMKMSGCQEIHSRTLEENAKEHKRIFQRLSQMDTSLRGNGNEQGLRSRVASLEEFRASARWATRAMFTTSIALIAHILYQVLQR